MRRLGLGFGFGKRGLLDLLSVVVNGLTNNAFYNSFALVGDHASLSLTVGGGAPDTQAWGSTPGGSEYGTAASPTDYSAADTGDPNAPALLYYSGTKDGKNFSGSVAIRAAVPVAAGALADQSIALGVQETYDISGDFTGADSYEIVTAPAGVTINASTGVITFPNTLTAQVGTSIVVRGVSSGGTADSGFSLTVAVLSVNLEPDNTLTVTATGSHDLTVTTPARFANTDTVDTADLAAGPLNIDLPVISGTAGIGETLTITPGLWINDEAAGAVSVAYQWRVDGVDQAGETGTTFTAVAGDITVRETVTDANGSRNVESAALSVAGEVSDYFSGTQTEGAYHFDTIGNLFQDTGATNPVTADGQSIAAVTSEGGGPNLTQSTASAQPVYNAADQSASFDGSTADSFDVALPVRSADTYIMAVFSKTNDGSCALVASGPGGSILHYPFLWFSSNSFNSGKFTSNAGTPTILVNGAAPSPAWVDQQDAYDTVIALNPGFVMIEIIGADITAPEFANLRFGALSNNSFGLDGQLHYLHVMANISAPDRAAVRQIVSNRYGVTLT